jgi:hypothetical protein
VCVCVCVCVRIRLTGIPSSRITLQYYAVTLSIRPRVGGH